MADGVLLGEVRLPLLRCALLSQVSYKLTVQYTRQRNFTYIRKKSAVLTAPIFTKFATGQ